MGFVFALASFVVPLLSRTVRGRKDVLITIWVILLARNAASVVNAFVRPLLPSVDDVEKFHLAALLERHPRAHEHLFYDNYVVWVRVLYGFFGPSKFLAQEASVLAFSMALVLLALLAVRLCSGRMAVLPLLCVGFLPSGIMFQSLQLKEAYQTLGCVALAAGLVFRPAGLWLSLAGGALLAAFHYAMTPVALLGAAVALWLLMGQAKLPPVVRAVVLILLAAWIWRPAAAYLVPPGRSYENRPLSENLVKYRSTITREGARTEYGQVLDTSNPVTFAATAARGFVLYMLCPFPWQISKAMDVLAFGEAFLRLALFAAALRNPRRNGVLLVFWLLVEAIWSIGTTNWGTSCRHHVVPFGLLSVAAFTTAGESGPASREKDSPSTEERP